MGPREKTRNVTNKLFSYFFFLNSIVKKALSFFKNLRFKHSSAFTASTVNKKGFRAPLSQLVLSPNDTALGYAKRLYHFYLPASPRFNQLRNGKMKHALITHLM